MISKTKKIMVELQSFVNPDKVSMYQNFFKTGPGQYGEGDLFIGVSVPHQRLVAKKHVDASLDDVQILLDSKIHEHRLTALLMLTYQFLKLSVQEQKRIVDFYLRNTKQVNNWDLVDLSAHKILGNYSLEHDKNASILYKLAQSKDLWEKRIAMVATYAFIRKGITKHTYKLAEQFLGENHDLMHKASGWMLREAGKQVSMDELERFVRKNHAKMPRTMLRYAIERFEEKKRKELLSL